MTYDPEARRDTPLALELKERIRASGSITVAQYMEACLQHAQYGYYRKQAAIGARADFVTAPEISQVFGELIGLWSAVVWQQMGSPERVNLVELGPGRGTLISDALRAARTVPAFHRAIHLYLAESNEALRVKQREVLRDAGVPIHEHQTWHTLFKELPPGSSIKSATWPGRMPDGPTIMIGNEFIDVLSVQQIVLSGGVWRHRRVGLDERGELAFEIGAESVRRPPDVIARAAREGDIFEVSFDRAGIVRALLGRRAARGLFAALFIDYGHARAALGGTVQAVRNHAHEHPLTSPGEADLTAQVDFETFANVGRSTAGVDVDGPVSQANFLGSLGIMQRAAKLMSANPGKAHEIEAGVARLMAVPGMGDRFKAIGIRSASLPPLPGFAEADSQ